MKTRLTAFLLPVFALAVLFFAAGCDRMDSKPQAAEVDEPGYRRGKELVRQGREPEAIIEFNKVLARRGLDNAPETNLELGILNERRDPTIAIFHFNKYRQTRPGPDRDALVLQRIEVAKREFMNMLPGRPSVSDATAAMPADASVLELNNKIQALQNENRRLRDALNAAPAAGGGGGAAPAATGTIYSSAPPVFSVAPASYAPPAPITVAAQSQTIRVQPQPQVQVQAQQLQQPRPQQQQQAQPAAQPQARAPGRAYAVKKGDSLFSIARQFYGTANNAQVEAIVKANRDVLAAGRDTPLREGMVLKLP